MKITYTKDTNATSEINYENVIHKTKPIFSNEIEKQRFGLLSIWY